MYRFTGSAYRSSERQVTAQELTTPEETALAYIR
jgi:hypothetical protein